MRVIAIAVAVWMFLSMRPLAEKFVAAKIANDSSIATDTKRVADAIESAYPAKVAR